MHPRESQNSFSPDGEDSSLARVRSFPSATFSFPLAVEWLDHMTVTNYSPRTIEEYPVDVEAFFKFAKVEPKDTKRANVTDWMGALRRRKLSPRTICRRVASVSSYFAFMRYRDESFHINPTEGVILPQVPSRFPDHLTPEEIGKMLAYDPGTHFQLNRAAVLAELLYSNGPRISEVVGLKRSDIDFKTGEVKVIGKGNKERVFVLDDKAKSKLAVWLEDHHKPEDSAVFFNRRGNGITASGLRQDLKLLAKAAGVTRRVYPHLLRHSVATHMLDAGVPLSSISKMLGHASVKTTEIYAHASMKQQVEAMTKHPRNAKPN